MAAAGADRDKEAKKAIEKQARDNNEDDIENTGLINLGPAIKPLCLPSDGKFHIQIDIPGTSKSSLPLSHFPCQNETDVACGTTNLRGRPKIISFFEEDVGDFGDALSLPLGAEGSSRDRTPRAAADIRRKVHFARKELKMSWKKGKHGKRLNVQKSVFELPSLSDAQEMGISDFYIAPAPKPLPPDYEERRHKNLAQKVQEPKTSPEKRVPESPGILRLARQLRDVWRKEKCPEPDRRRDNHLASLTRSQAFQEEEIKRNNIPGLEKPGTSYDFPSKSEYLVPQSVANFAKSRTLTKDASLMNSKLDSEPKPKLSKWANFKRKLLCPRMMNSPVRRDQFDGQMAGSSNVKDSPPKKPTLLDPEVLKNKKLMSRGAKIVGAENKNEEVAGQAQGRESKGKRKGTVSPDENSPETFGGVRKTLFRTNDVEEVDVKEESNDPVDASSYALDMEMYASAAAPRSSVTK